MFVLRRMHPLGLAPSTAGECVFPPAPFLYLMLVGVRLNLHGFAACRKPYCVIDLIDGLHLCAQGIAPLKTPAEAISECPAPGNSTADMPCWCLPQFQEAVVTASNIARMGSNLWMLGAVAFLARFSLQPSLLCSEMLPRCMMYALRFVNLKSSGHRERHAGCQCLLMYGEFHERTDAMCCLSNCCINSMLTRHD